MALTANGMNNMLGKLDQKKLQPGLDPAHVELERLAAMDEVVLHVLPFPKAARIWLDQHQLYIKPVTLRGYQNAVNLFGAFLGDVIVKDIHIGHIRAYQVERRKRAGPYLINAEVGVLSMVLKEARCWTPIADLYRPLKVPKRKSGHSLTVEQEARLREVAFSRPKWRLAAHCMVVMLSTTMGFGELRHVRRQDVDMEARCIHVVEGAKNDYRDRTIPMNSAAYDSMCWLLDRWKDLGGRNDSDFILPHRPRTNKGPWIFSEPMTAITSAFRQIRSAAGVPEFRIYDCRVQAITKLLQNPNVSTQVSREIAGHISQAMQSRYSIQRFDAKKAALDALEPKVVIPKSAVQNISDFSDDESRYRRVR
jgi:integrase